MGGHAAWNANEEGYKYTKEEIEAYQIPIKILAGPCVDTFIPLKQCFKANPAGLTAMLLDARKGKCSKEFSIYDNCLTHWATYENNSHVTNAYWNNKSKATEDGISATYAAKHRKGPIWTN